MACFRGLFRFFFVKGPKETNITTALLTLSALAAARQKPRHCDGHEMKAKVAEVCGSTRRKFLLTVFPLPSAFAAECHSQPAPSSCMFELGMGGKVDLSMQNA